MSRPQESTIVKHIPPSISTALGNLDQEHKNLQSKKQVKYELDIEEDKYFYPDIETVKTHELCATIIPFNINIKGFSYLTGTSPHKSILGNLYFMVMYDYDSNSILSEPIKNRQASTIRDALLKMHNIIKSRGINQKVYITDNECASDLKEYMKNTSLTYKLPHRTCTDEVQ